MNKSILIFVGPGLVICGCMTMAYLGQRELSSGSEMVPAAPSVAKVTPKSSATPPSSWTADDQDVSTLAASSEAQSQPAPSASELAQRFQDALAAGDTKQTLDAMTAWANADPNAAAQFAGSMRSGPQRDRLLREVAQRWAARDTAAALAWATQSGATAEREQLVTAICSQVGETDPQEAIVLAERSGQQGDYASVKGQMAERWAAQDPSAAVGWALSQPTGDERNQFVAEVATIQARKSPVEAVNLVIKEIPPGPEQDNAVLATLDGWARQDLRAATAWVNQFSSDDPLRERANAVLAASQNKQSPL